MNVLPINFGLQLNPCKWHTRIIHVQCQLASLIIFWVKNQYDGPKMTIESPCAMYFQPNEIESQIKTFNDVEVNTFFYVQVHTTLN
jgi:hypothetical protein